MKEKNEMFIKLKVYHVSSYSDGTNRYWMMLNTDQIVTVLRNADGLRVDTSDGKYFFIDPSCEKVLLNAIHVDI